MNEQFEEPSIDDNIEDASEIQEVNDPTVGYIDDPDEYVKRTGKPIETFRTRDQYDEFGSLRDDIKSLKDEVTKWRNTAQGMSALYTDLDKKNYDKAYNDIQEKMFEASQDSDYQAYNQYNQELQNLSWQDQQKRLQANQEAIKKVETQFSEKNGDWYNTNNPELQRKAQVLFKKYLASNPNTNIADLLQLVEDEIREFHLPKKAQATSPPSIPRGVSNANKSAHIGRAKIPPELRKEFETFKSNMTRMGITEYSENDFISYKKKYGEL